MMPLRTTLIRVLARLVVLIVLVTPVHSFAFSPIIPVALITPDNVSQLRLYRQLGRGTITQIAVSPAHDTLAVATDIGVWFYDMENLTAFPHLASTTTPILSLAFSPDGSRLLGGTLRGTILEWDTRSYQVVTSVSAASSAIYALAYSANGETIASAGEDDQVIILWNAANFTQLEQIVFPSELLEGGGRASDIILSVAFSPDSTQLAIGESGDISVWDITRHEIIAKLEGATGLARDIAFSPDGSLFGMVDYGGNVLLWKTENFSPVANLNAHSTWQVNGLAFTPDGQTLITGGADKSLITWEIAAGLTTLTKKNEHVHNEAIIDVAFASETHLISETPTRIELWDLEQDKPVLTIGGHIDRINDLAFSPDGQFLALATAAGTVIVWRIPDFSLHAALEIDTTWITCLAFSPDSRVLAVGDSNGRVELWDIVSLTEIESARRHRSSVQDLAFSPDGQTLATGGSDYVVKLMSVPDLDELSVLEPPLEEWVYSLDFSPDGQSLVLGRYGSIEWWDTRDEDLLYSWEAHDWAVFGMTFSPSGNFLASSSEDGTVRLWNSANRTEIIALLDIARPSETLRSYSVSFSPDERLLAAANESGTLHVWDISTYTTSEESIPLKAMSAGSGPEAWKIQAHNLDASAVVFSPDGLWLASAGWDGTVLIWAVLPD